MKQLHVSAALEEIMMRAKQWGLHPWATQKPSARLQSELSSHILTNDTIHLNPARNSAKPLVHHVRTVKKPNSNNTISMLRQPSRNNLKYVC